MDFRPDTKTIRVLFGDIHASRSLHYPVQHRVVHA